MSFDDMRRVGHARATEGAREAAVAKIVEFMHGITADGVMEAVDWTHYTDKVPWGDEPETNLSRVRRAYRRVRDNYADLQRTYHLCDVQRKRLLAEREAAKGGSCDRPTDAEGT